MNRIDQATRFSSDAWGEFKTPLLNVRAGLERLIESPFLVPDDRLDIADALDQLRGIHQVTDALMMLSRADSGQLGLRPKAGHLADLVRVRCDEARTLADARRITISLECHTSAGACFDEMGTSVVLRNLLGNAIKYNVRGGRILVRVSLTGRFCTVEVGNTGPTIPAEVRNQVFDRFFRAADSSASTGHGLGLSVARELARAQGGDVVLIDGTVLPNLFTFTLPAIC